MLPALLTKLLLAPALLAAAPDAPWAPPAGAEREALVAQCVRADAEPGFFRASGGSYVVKTDVGREFALDVACWLERFRSQFRHIFRDPLAERYAPLVVVFRDRARYRKSVGAADASRGTYVAKAKTLFTFLDAERGERDFASFYTKILAHEGAHQLLGAMCGSGALPVWFDEGVASYFQEWDVRHAAAENLARLRTERYRAQDVRAAFGTARWVPLARLFGLSREQWAPDDFGPRTNLHYAEAASFVSFLLATPRGQGIFERIYTGVKAERPVSDVLDGAALRALDAAWREDVAAEIAAAAGG